MKTPENNKLLYASLFSIILYTGILYFAFWAVEDDRPAFHLRKLVAAFIAGIVTTSLNILVNRYYGKRKKQENSQDKR